jgi:hypothetical protein
MALGIDCDEDVRPILTELKTRGVEFVARYLGGTKRSPLTIEEARAISAAGMFNVSICERGDPTDVSYFDFQRGAQDGQAMYAALLALTQPPGTPVYFCVDFDATEADITAAVVPYFTGVRQAFAQGTGNPSQRNTIGVYGNGLVCERLKSLGLVHFTWLAQPVDWGGSGYAGYNLHQTHGGTIDGVDLDFDESSDLGGGGWKLPSA